MFEHFDVPYKTIKDAELKARGLESMYDVIILPNDSLQAMTGDSPGAGGGRQGGPSGSSESGPPKTTRRRNIAADSAPKA